MLDASKARPARVAAVLLPAAVSLHESVALLPGTPLARPDGPLPVILPLLATLAAGAVSAGLVSQLLARSFRSGPSRALPVLIAAALIGIFLAQEGSETLLRSGGTGTIEGLFMAVALLVPLALMLGVAVTAALLVVCQAARAIIARVRWRTLGSRKEARPARAAQAGRARRIAIRPLAFGLARRPPPLTGSTYA